MGVIIEVAAAAAAFCVGAFRISAVWLFVIYFAMCVPTIYGTIEAMDPPRGVFKPPLPARLGLIRVAVGVVVAAITCGALFGLGRLFAR